MANTYSAASGGSRRFDSGHLWHRVAEPSFAILRIATGALFACHGAQKLLGLFGGTELGDVFSMMGVAGAIELVGGTLIALGLGASWFALIACVEMIVAYFMVHAPK